MDASIAAVSVAPALAVGSFLNVVASRLPVGGSIVTPASACPHCDTPIRRRDNIPVFSYLWLRGHCRDCRTAIGVRYPAVELATAALVVVSFLVFGATFQAVAAAIFCAALVTISATDIETRLVPNRIVLPATVAVLGFQMLWDPSVEWIAAGLGAALFLFIVALIYPRGMGMGDVKLALLLGVGVGRAVPFALFLGMAFAMIPAVVLFCRHGGAARKMKIPFAPFLALGGIVALFAGGAMVDWYLSFL